jgi:hypothetical protein
VDGQKDLFVKKINDIEESISTTRDTTLININDVHNEIISLKNAATEVFNDLNVKQKIASENEKQISVFVANIDTRNAAIEIIQKNTAQWEQEIIKAKTDILDSSVDYNALNSKFKTSLTQIENAYEKIFGKTDKDGKVSIGFLQEIESFKSKISAFLGEQTIKYNAQFSQIEGLLPGATSTGLAEAYQLQKKSYKKPIQLWSGVFISIMCIMTILSVILFYVQFGKSTSQTLGEAFISLLKDLPFFIPTIWLASYASKQQSQYKRLQQEYAFKETNAKSFHGHKMQVEELMKDGSTDKDLLLQLVAQLVIITSQNPSSTLDSKSHDDSPPIFKLAERLIPSLYGKSREDKNISEVTIKV